MKHAIYAAAGFVCLNLGHVADGWAVSIIDCQRESCLPGSRIYAECDKHFPKSYNQCLELQRSLELQRKKGETPPILRERIVEAW